MRYTTPLGSSGDFTASYRLYDHNNDNDVFNIGEYVRFDQVIEELTRNECDPAANVCHEIVNPPTPLFEYKNSTLSLDAGWRLGGKYRAFVGYQFERWDREHRDTEQTDTNRIKVGLDAYATDWATVRISYQRSKRESDFFEVDSPTYLVIPLRRFDIANVDQDAFRILADFTPSEKTSLGATLAITNNDYKDTLFGLQKWDDFSIGFDFSYALAANSSFNVWYEHAEIDRDQMGRQSGATPSTTPDFDWFINITDKYDTVGAGYSTAFSEGKTVWVVNLSYAFANGNADITAGAAVRPTGATGLEDFDDTDLFSFRTGLNCKVFPRTRFGVFYWYEQYNIDDFAENEIQTDMIFLPNPLGGPPIVGGAVTLNAVQPDYQFHSGWVGFMFNW